MSKDTKELFFCSERAQWRAWLGENYDKKEEIWFVFPTKEAGEPCISYNDAVEEALCFGWIDGRAGSLDAQHHIRRFTPRRPGSPHSRPNIERLIWLYERDMIAPQLRENVESVIREPFVFPEDILSALRADKTVWENYCAFSAPYKRIRIAYIDAARKRPEEFRKRLKNFIEKTRQNKLIIGYGGIEKYYRGEEDV
ncbi:MAG: hypothetical protein E7517_02405 [Ruminococcaceae bacterium]|nr:hypothetical protein [Oscillospiraceae bacterium]